MRSSTKDFAIGAGMFLGPVAVVLALFVIFDGGGVAENDDPATPRTVTVYGDIETVCHDDHAFRRVRRPEGRWFDPVPRARPPMPRRRAVISEDEIAASVVTYWEMAVAEKPDEPDDYPLGVVLQCFTDDGIVGLVLSESQARVIGEGLVEAARLIRDNTTEET